MRLLGSPGGREAKLGRAAICLGTGTIYSKKQYIITSLDKHVNSETISQYINISICSGTGTIYLKKKTIFHHLVRQTIYQYVNSFGTGTIYSKFALNPPKKLTYETFCWSERHLTQFVLGYEISVFLTNFIFLGKTR